MFPPPLTTRECEMVKINDIYNSNREINSDIKHIVSELEERALVIWYGNNTFTDDEIKGTLNKIVRMVMIDYEDKYRSEIFRKYTKEMRGRK